MSSLFLSLFLINIGIYSVTLSFKYCVGSIPHIMKFFIYIFIKKYSVLLYYFLPWPGSNLRECLKFYIVVNYLVSFLIYIFLMLFHCSLRLCYVESFFIFTKWSFAFSVCDWSLWRVCLNPKLCLLLSDHELVSMR